MSVISPFFAYLSRLRWIKRWSLMRNAIHEDVALHSWEVASIAHALGLIYNHLNTDQVDANRLAAIGIYHDASEVITGDMPTPVKYHSEAMREAYKGVEKKAQAELLALVPDALRPAYREILLEHELPEVYKTLLKAADRLSALLKCRAERRAGNPEFAQAEEEIERRLRNMQCPAADYFLEVFAPAYDKSLDHLLG